MIFRPSLICNPVALQTKDWRGFGGVTFNVHGLKSMVTKWTVPTELTCQSHRLGICCRDGIHSIRKRCTQANRKP